MADRWIATPFHAMDCSLVSDGAAALVLADIETALQLDKAIAFRATAHVSDFLPMSKRDILKFEGCTEAWQRALADAGITLRDLSLVETHDCFTIAELLEYEAMGLRPHGQGARAILDGDTRRDSGRYSLTCVRERQRTGRTSAPATGSREITSAAAPSDTSEQSERLSGPATNGFLSDGWRQNSYPRSRFMCAYGLRTPFSWFLAEIAASASLWSPKRSK